MTAHLASEQAELTGQILLHYEVRRLLAQGRSSLVFLGKDTRNGKIVALKVLGSEYARIEEEVQRFIRGWNRPTSSVIPTSCGSTRRRKGDGSH